MKTVNLDTALTSHYYACIVYIPMDTIVRSVRNYQTENLIFIAANYD